MTIVCGRNSASPSSKSKCCASNCSSPSRRRSGPRDEMEEIADKPAGSRSGEHVIVPMVPNEKAFERTQEIVEATAILRASFTSKTANPISAWSKTSCGIAREPICIWAETGEEALEMAAAKPPHLVLLDLDLPDIHGSKVLESLQAQPGHGRNTGHRDQRRRHPEPDRAHARRRGA